METLRTTPFFEFHKDRGGRMVPFAGFSMPVQYTGIKDEHLSVRESVGVFDVSHMGEIFIRGKDALRYCQRMTSNDASRLKPGQAQYTLILNETGGVRDDVLLYRLTDDEFFMCVNASNVEKIGRWLSSQKGSLEVSVEDQSADWAQLAIQGPKTALLLKDWIGFDLSSLSPFDFTIMASPVHPRLLISRTGYTGEQGVELYFENRRPEETLSVLTSLLEAGRNHSLTPCGLGCRDTLRMEMGYPLYGHELSEDTSPLDAGLDWVVKLNKTDAFIGQTALKEYKSRGIRTATIGLKSESPQPLREKLPVYFDENPVGFLTSGSYSPSLKVGFGIARVSQTLEETTISSLYKAGASVEIRGRRQPVHVCRLPFVPSRVR